jgi:hypothetical protein
MRALVVYESLFGNTELVARSVGEGIGLELEVVVLESAAGPPRISASLDLIVIGGPSDAFGTARATTRGVAPTRSARGRPVEGGIRAWLAQLTAGRHLAAIATFDTRHRRGSMFPGSAARGAARAAHRLGYDLAGDSASFYVEELTGALLPGELVRARVWGQELAAGAVARDLVRRTS